MNTAVVLAIVVLGYIALATLVAVARHIVPRLRHLFNVLTRTIEQVQWPKHEIRRWNVVRRIPRFFDAIVRQAVGGPQNAILYRFAQVLAYSAFAILFVVWLIWLVTRGNDRGSDPAFWVLSVSFGLLIVSVFANCCYDFGRELLRRLFLAIQDTASKREIEEAHKIRLRQLAEAQQQFEDAQRRRQEEEKARAAWEQYHRHRRIEEIDGMNWRQFEEFAITLFQKAGFLNAKGTPSNDQGADILCEEIQGDGRTKKVVVQAKHWRGRVGNGAVQEVLGAMAYYRADLAFVLTTSGYTTSARRLAASDARIRLIDRAELVRWIERYWPREIPAFDWEQYSKNVKSRYRDFRGTNRTFSRPGAEAPMCPNCSARMSLITPGPTDTWKPFWGCTQYKVTGCKGGRVA